MERVGWPEPGMRITFLTEGPNTPLPPPDMRQIAYRLPKGTRVMKIGSGFVLAHPHRRAVRITFNAAVDYAPRNKVRDFLNSDYNFMDGSSCLRFGALERG